MVIDQIKNQRRFIVFLQDFYAWSLSFLLSLIACLSVIAWLPKTSLSQWLFAGSLLIFATLILMFTVHWLIFDYMPRRLGPGYKNWKFGLTGMALLAGLWLSANTFFPVPPAEFSPGIHSFLLKLAYRTGIGIALGVLLVYAITWMATALLQRIQLALEKPLFKSALKYALPTALIWGIYLMAFYPAMMSSDSMDQWGQVLAGRFVDHHPAFHTFLIWLLTRISLSPTIVAIAQIITLAFVAGLWFSFFETLAIRRWVIWLMAAIFALVPVNGTMVVTLWKDIAYSTAVLGLTLLMLRVVVTGGKWVHPVSAQFILGITSALVLLLRHDGMVVGVGAILILLVAYPQRWRAWLVSGLVCAVLYFGVRGPVYRWVGVEKSSNLTTSSLSLYSMAAYATPGSETANLISSLQLTSPAWGCSIWSNVPSQTLKTDIDKSIPLFQALGNILRRLPNLLAYDARCARSLEWVIWDPLGEVRNPSHAEVWIDKNTYGIEPASKIPAMRKWLSDWVVKTSYNPNQNWYIWRPAIYLYLNLLLSAVLIIRNRNLRFGLLSVPILLQSISFTLILAQPNFRYHYAVYLVSLISIPLFLSAPIEPLQPAQVSSSEADLELAHLDND